MDLSIIITAVSGLVAAVGTYLVAHYKSKNDSFNSIIKANESFRDEIRKDLIQSRKELEAASSMMAKLREEIDSLRQDLNDATSEIKSLSDNLRQAKFEREDLKNLLAKAHGEREAMRAELMESIRVREELTLRVAADEIEIARLKALLQS